MKDPPSEAIELVPNYMRAIHETLLRIEALVASKPWEGPARSYDSRATMSIKEAAQYVGVSRNRMYELAHAGTVKSIRVGQKFVRPRQRP